MPLTKQYLRYVHQSSFGVVGSRKSAAILLETRSRQLRIVAAALEDVVIWNPRRGEKVKQLLYRHTPLYNMLCYTGSCFPW